ncbi:MAG: hypothetical protein [Wendovervirus sonii]|uniref:Uncharacterized protein n=1 Tax=phage Lak_Megaphage_Sonny TaxID=3109229 RepID=A0ABZ0Z311_9CAUD|nr:MAG: hypothetical protein [phage Lak_Megaphage_Sonny]
MISKSEIIKKYKKNYKPSFLLAWARFLTYDELVKTENTEPLEKRHMLENATEWNKLVIPYKEENVINALCIELSSAIKALNGPSAISALLYYDDILVWLKILENNNIYPLSLKKSYSEKAKQRLYKDIMEFYKKISDYYQFHLFD